jgi:hypothetical protein
MKHRLTTTPVLSYPNFELPFILTTDASKIAVAAILSEVQDGIERTVAYASRQMNKSEVIFGVGSRNVETGSGLPNFCAVIFVVNTS